MVSRERREAIKSAYRMLRIKARKTQREVEADARLSNSRFWRIENGFDFPTPDERARIAAALNVKPARIPAYRSEKAVSA
jgi:transcriptional regulator with XRE-family HTH domain